MNGDNKQDRFVKLSEAAKTFGVSTRTIYRWRDSNQIVWKQTPSGQFIYKVTNSKTITESRKNIIYVRVSSSKQADDLERQKTFMQQQFPSYEVITDIGSGLNFKRRGLQCLLRLVMSNSVKEIVVSSKDRLCRFGYELLEWIFNRHNTKLVVLESTSITKDQQFVNDILSIIQIYSCKWNGSRRYSFKDKKNKIEIDIQPKTNTTKME